MRHTTRGRVVGGLLSLMLSATVSQADQSVFKVCADPNNPPLSTRKNDGLENKIAELFAADLGQQLEYTWFPQRLGFIRNTLKAKQVDGEGYQCDVVMGVPTGFELAATTSPYYRSVYALVYKRGHGLDSVKTPEDIDKLPDEKKSVLRIAMFDGAPGTTWLLNHGLIGQGIPYQTMTGDVSENAAQVLARDFAADKIDMVIIWGPMAGYIASQDPAQYEVIPMKAEKGLKFDFPISMGVRVPDKQRKQQLDELIVKNAEKIQALVQSYRIPMVDKDGKTVAAK